MKIVEFSLKRPVTIVMLMVSLVMFGWISFKRLPINLLPDISYPTITIRTKYPGAAPAEVENHITKTLEEAVSIIPDVIRVSSVSRAGISDVIVEFTWKTDMDYASLDIREKLDQVALPKDAEHPLLLRFNPSFDPILRIGLYGDESLVKLRLMAEDEIKPMLEGLSSEEINNIGEIGSGIAAVKISGGLEEEIHIEIAAAKLSSLGIQISEITQRLVEENVNLTGGAVMEGKVEYLVRTLTEFKQIDEIKDIVILSNENQIVTLGDIASVTKGFKEISVITRTNGKESVEIAVFKEADANTVKAARLVKARLKELQDKLALAANNIKMDIVYDQSRFIEHSIKDVIYTALWGGLLAIFTLYLFLRNIKSTIIIGLAIPLSVMACFFFMYISNVTINIMSLGGMALGIGMLVDNSIVVLENINRYRQNGYTQHEAARLGANDVGKAVTASTLTTICVFAPMIFVKGIVGQMFIDQALTVIYSLLTSLLVAITLIPMLSSLSVSFKFLDPIRSAKPKPQEYAFGMTLSVVLIKYSKVIEFALKKKSLLFACVLICFAGSWKLLNHVGKEFIPEISQGEFYLSIKNPEGTPIKTTLDTVKKMEGLISDMPEVKKIYTIAGTTSQIGGAAMEERENVAEIDVILKEGISMKEEEMVINSIRDRLKGISQIEHKFSHPALFSFATPIEVEITGYNLKRLKLVSDQIMNKLKDIHGLSDIKTTIEEGTPEIQINFNRQKLAKMGLDINSIASTIKSYVLGAVETEFRQQDRSIDIRVMADKEDLKGIKDLKNLTINPQSEIPVPLYAVADINAENSASTILRVNHERTAIVSANLSGVNLQSAVNKIEKSLTEIRLPQDFAVNVSGQSREMAQAFSSMKFAILLAIFLVYLVMASQFESLLNPLTIMFTIPFALVGSVLALYITNKAISVVVLIGVVMLAGIAVNNAIVLVDCINQRRREGMEKRAAIIEAGRLRFRPILMTTATTILALLPMSFGLGKGAELRTAMGITVIGGLFTSTILTLIIIPLVYDLIEDCKKKIVNL